MKIIILENENFSNGSRNFSNYFNMKNDNVPYTIYAADREIDSQSKIYYWTVQDIKDNSGRAFRFLRFIKKIDLIQKKNLTSWACSIGKVEN